MAARNGFWGSPNRDKAIALKTQGWTNANIAAFISDLEGLTDDLVYTEKQVHSYLTNQMETSSASKLIAMNKGKDLVKFQSIAERMMASMQQEYELAKVAGDYKAIEAMAKGFGAWYDRGLLVNGLASTGGNTFNTQINLGKTEKEVEVEAFVKAAKEEFAKDPLMWDRVVVRTRALMEGAVFIPGAIEVTPTVISSKVDILPDDVQAVDTGESQAGT